MRVSPLYEAIQLYGEPEQVDCVYLRLSLPEQKCLLAELTSKPDLSFEEFQMLAKLKGGSKHIAQVLSFTVGTIYNMKQRSLRDYYERYKKRKQSL